MRNRGDGREVSAGEERKVRAVESLSARMERVSQGGTGGRRRGCRGFTLKKSLLITQTAPKKEPLILAQLT